MSMRSSYKTRKLDYYSDIFQFSLIVYQMEFDKTRCLSGGGGLGFIVWGAQKFGEGVGGGSGIGCEQPHCL